MSTNFMRFFFALQVILVVVVVAVQLRCARIVQYYSNKSPTKLACICLEHIYVSVFVRFFAIKIMN